MSDPLRIEFEWLDWEIGSEIDRAFAASIGLAVGEQYLTCLEDLGARTVRNQMRGSAWRLGTWFAVNWWRLRWEPAPGKWWDDTEWRLAHSVAAAGGGYVWPNAVFASDGDSIEIAARPNARAVPFEPIRYLNHVHTRVSAAEFEQRVDDFIEGVLSRLDSLRVEDTSLPGLWKEVLDERSDPESSQIRKLEAMAGYDPDGAPDELLRLFIRDEERLGKDALAEVAAEGRSKAAELVAEMRELSRSKTDGFRGCLPSLKRNHSLPDGSGPPWHAATQLARDAREQWGFGGAKPIKNSALARLLDADPDFFSQKTATRPRMSFALRGGSNGEFNFHFDSSNPTSRRFALSRIIGDHLLVANDERLLPATHAKTSRQKFQRAFAQEFLCPIQALLDKIQTDDPNEDDISEAAKHFHVSPLMVRTTLVNHHELDREALAWPDFSADWLSTTNIRKTPKT